MEHSEDIRESRRKEKYHREKLAAWWTFILSMALTAFAFMVIVMGAIEHRVTIYLFLVLLAITQVIVQIYFFMHMRDTGHRFPQMFFFSGLFVAIVLIYGMVEWLWW